MTYPKELLQLERHAYAVIKAMPEIKAAYDNLEGVERLEEIQRIGSEYGLGSVV